MSFLSARTDLSASADVAARRDAAATTDPLARADFFPARAVVDLDAIRSNVHALRAHAPTAQVMAVVKADAYGHGLVPVARAAVDAGATWLGVAQADEALALRAAGLTPRLLTWLYSPSAPLRELIDADVDVSVAAPWALVAVIAAARAAGRTARIHLKVDTGLGRNGMLPPVYADVLDAALAAQAEGAVAVVGVWSHFAFADEPAHPTVVAQAGVFADAVALADARGAALEVRHLANSAATLTNPAVHYDLVRPGLAMYGLSPVPQLGGPAAFGLLPAMTLEADLATVKEVPAGQGVSYAHAYSTTQTTRLGVVPLGYADGIPRHASGSLPEHPGGPVQVGGRRLAVAGRVCMDQFVVDLGPDAPEQAGARVELFGAGTDGGPTAQDWADAAGTISYEIVTRVGARIPRVYLDDPAGQDREPAGQDREPAEPGREPVEPGRVEPGRVEPGRVEPGRVELSDAAATRAYGHALAGVLRAGDLVLLTGDLGAGKTTLTQGIGTGLGVRGQVASPTFTIARVHPSLADGPALVHVDAYRLGSLDEVDGLDLDASMAESVTVVEWGEGLVESLAQDRLEIALTRPRGGLADLVDLEDLDAADGVRVARVRAVGTRWAGVALPVVG
ncbi:alanine racemase [Pengzhenrongella sicca]|uniref:Alanine racemase n=1 Tax=Pengzhenrongella sicca TaxID=2819238 RepID=A0A8A4ZG31_9MICO|nr:alanine racemase [Pengzhenrongella sicca]